MDEYSIPVLLCEYLNSMEEDTPFVPETWREGAATVMLSGGDSAVREYVDGSSVVSVPFEVHLRCSHTSIKCRLDAVEFFSRIASFVRETPVVLDGVALGEVSAVGGTFKSAVYENGEEEYRASYSFRYLKKA